MNDSRRRRPNRRRAGERPPRHHAAKQPDAGGAPAKLRTLPAHTFAAAVSEAAKEMGIAVADLSLLPYDDELRVKNNALKRFCKTAGIDAFAAAESIVPSALPRQYRTTSKRKVIAASRGLKLVSPGDADTAALLEPPEHAHLYNEMISLSSHPAYAALNRSLNYVIIRGTYEERMLILNVCQLSGPIVNKARDLCNALREGDPRLAGAFLYLDPTRSDYFLEAKRPDDAVTFKKLYGHDRFRLAVETLTFQIEPTSFSQVNQSMLAPLIKTVREMLQPQDNSRLLDLYCGYGLFSYALAGGYRESIGIDAAKSSIASAIGAQKHNSHAPSIRFLLAMISGRTLEELLPLCGDRAEDVILDPPKSGCDPQVIAAVAARNPRRAVHIFCGTDEIPRALAAWKKGGYTVKRIVPLDMFAGTPNLETVILLERV